MIEIKVVGEVVKRVFNEKQTAASGIEYAIDYIVLKCDPRDTKKGAVNDYIPIEVFSSNVSEPYIRDVREGYRVEFELFLEALIWTDEVVVRSFKQKNGYEKRSPQIYPKFTIKTMTVLSCDDKETRGIANRDFEKNIVKQDPKDDLPF